MVKIMNLKSPRFFGIQHVSVLVSDTATALGFYRDILGLPVSTRRPDLGFAGAWLDVGPDQEIHLLELPNPDPRDGRPEHGGRDRHLALAVESVDAFRQRLSAAGIAFTESKSGRKAIFCRDCDGNAIELFQVKS